MPPRAPFGSSFAFQAAGAPGARTLRAAGLSTPAATPRATAVVLGVEGDAPIAGAIRAFGEALGCAVRFVGTIGSNARQRGDQVVLIPVDDAPGSLPALLLGVRSEWGNLGVLGVYQRVNARRIVEAMRAGVDDCIELDAAEADSVETLRRWIERGRMSPGPREALGKEDLCSTGDVGKEDLGPTGGVGKEDLCPTGGVALPGMYASFVTGDRSLRQRLAALSAAAASDETILLQGPTGTGKTLLASLLHQGSRRAAGPFVEVSCAALSPTLLESELFGHLRGAYTGATSESPGKVGAAAGGTLFLDEVDSLPPELQGKLLRLLQSRTYEPVGGHLTRTADVRFMAASNADLGGRIAGGRFRQDLYYRLSVVRFELPPLAERGEDIAALAEHLLRQACERTGRNVAGFDAAAMAALRGHGWPGNVRELENAVRSAVLTTPGERIGVADLPPEIRGRERGSRGAGLRRRVEEAERASIEDALKRAGNCRTDAAAALGITRITLYNKMKKLGIT